MARGYCNKHVQFHDLLASKVVRNPLKKNVVRNEILRFFLYIYIYKRRNLGNRKQPVA
jgi:hypothetical protein